jgi:hypothetical protein
VSIVRQIREVLLRLLLASVVALVVPGNVTAQVGLASNAAQVMLVARVAPRAMFDSVAAIQEEGRQGLLRDLSMTVGLAANAPHHLVVRRADAAGGAVNRIWVRAAGGEFQLLEGDSGIVAVGELRGIAEERRREIYFKVEVTDSVSPVEAMPVRYELVVDSGL